MIQKRKIFPCYFGSALKLEGIDTFLEAFDRYTICPEYADTFGAKVYKISRDAQGMRLTHLKVTGGSLRVKMVLKEEEKVDQTGDHPSCDRHCSRSYLCMEKS